MVAAATGEAFEIPFGGSLQLQYVADAGEAFVRAGEVRAEGASVHNLDGPVASVEEIVAAIEAAEPGARITMARTRCRSRPRSTRARSPTDRRPDRAPLDEGVAEAIERFRAS